MYLIIDMYIKTNIWIGMNYDKSFIFHFWPYTTDDWIVAIEIKSADGYRYTYGDSTMPTQDPKEARGLLTGLKRTQILNNVNELLKYDVHHMRIMGLVMNTDWETYRSYNEKYEDVGVLGSKMS